VPAPTVILAEPEPIRAEATRNEPEPKFLAPEPEPTPAVILAEPEPAEAEATRGEPGPELPRHDLEPEPVMAANDTTPEPAVKPIIIGADEDVVVEKKRGWWRR
jgi:hypothetical protein